MAAFSTRSFMNPQGMIAKLWTRVNPHYAVSKILAAIPAPKGCFTSPVQAFGPIR
jgi:hypothetical protein